MMLNLFRTEITGFRLRDQREQKKTCLSTIDKEEPDLIQPSIIFSTIIFSI